MMIIVIVVVLAAVLILAINNLINENKKSNVVSTTETLEVTETNNIGGQDVLVKKVNTNKKSNSEYMSLSILGFVGFIISVLLGFYKMFVYENSDSYISESKNSYVGGDAYNYIINGTHTTAYFVLGLICMVFACTMLILNEMSKHRRTI